MKAGHKILDRSFNRAAAFCVATGGWQCFAGVAGITPLRFDLPVGKPPNVLGDAGFGSTCRPEVAGGAVEGARQNRCGRYFPL